MRKLDIAIAEALGYEVEKRESYRWGCLTIKYDTLLPKYSTDGNAMLKLIEGMRKKGWRLYDIEQDGINGTGYVAQFTDNKNPAWAEADTMPEAVAKVAYKALAGEEWNEGAKP